MAAGATRYWVLGLFLIFSQLSFVNAAQIFGGQPPATKAPIDYRVPVAADEIKFMNYNVENLFDTESNPNKEDYTFIPKSDPAKADCVKIPAGNYRRECQNTDWTQDRVDVKLGQIKKVVDAQGDLPDVLTIEEIESDKVASQLAAKLGFGHYIITNGPDERGINVALMYNENKLEFIDHVVIPVTYKDPSFAAKPTRDILCVHFRLKGQTGSAKDEILAVFVNHWPSQAAPSAKRVATAEVLKSAINNDSERYATSNYYVVAVGDFNTVDADHPSPFFTVLENGNWERRLADVHDLYMNEYAPRDPLQLAKRMPLGTYFYFPKWEWSRLDRFFISNNLHDKSGVDLVGEYYRIVAPDFATDKAKDELPTSHTHGSVIYGVPWGFDHRYKAPDEAGFSDHFPIVMKVRVR